ncbi:hypothetical protein N7532_007191 [Penicillium argentinense]|uniref:Uncharacterized protein n=1 Tax=Penicillium argentinense TaxID=1131581 RepID=A0A9W9F7G8_9EURO|nr:uncharacterized protein N7532_007191 [Penicillium argentinense]KAJ5094900.1 hypothetical protein N7532_007191 [Penicillium argentinense]
MNGLKEAIRNSSKENWDPILATSILLSWQSTERRVWMSLRSGLITILNTLDPRWKEGSELARYLESQLAPTSTGSVMMAGTQFQENVALLDYVIASLRNVPISVFHNQEYYSRAEELLNFTLNFRKDIFMISSDEAFKRVQQLREWLFWLPAAMIRGHDCDTYALSILTQFFCVGICLDPLLPDIGGAYLAPVSIGPLEDICRIICFRAASNPLAAHLHLASVLVELPRHIVNKFKNRLNWAPHHLRSTEISSAPIVTSIPAARPPDFHRQSILHHLS